MPECGSCRRADKVNNISAAPGNAGISSLETCVDIKAEYITAIAKFAVTEKVDLVAAGGRVLEVAGWGVNFSQARKRAYEAAGKIHFKDSF